MTIPDLVSLAPEIVLTLGGITVLLFDAFAPQLRRLWIPCAILFVVVAAAVSTRLVPGSSFGGFLEWSPISAVVTQIILCATLLCLLASQGYLIREGILGGEYPALLLWCSVGLLLMMRATELLTVFVALELLSVCLYALAGFHHRLGQAFESALKYFVMGAFASAFVLLGLALVFGETGSTRFADIAAALAGGGGSPRILGLGFLLLVSGFGFKMSLVPFHAWAPDTYQGAPSPFVAFLSVAPKVASAVVLWRLLDLVALGGAGEKWPGLVAILSVLSMVVGNLLALVQKDIKRMLAYSGIGHMGYVLIPLVALDQGSVGPLLTYLLAYTLMNAGAFVVVSLLYARPGEQHLIAELSGWGHRFPVLGASLAICMLALGGIPPTLGFLGKYLVFGHAIRTGHLGLAIVGIASSLVGVVYYLRVVYVLYMKAEIADPTVVRPDFMGRVAAVLAAGGVLLLGIWPARLLAWLTNGTPPL